MEITNFATDNALTQACGQHDDYVSGHFKMSKLLDMDLLETDALLRMARHAGDFTLADRESWKLMNGYREAGANRWAEMELLLTAAWSLDIPVAHQPSSTFNCHQQSRLTPPQQDTDTDINAMRQKKVSYMNKHDQWGLQGHNLYKEGMQCEVFRGGLGM